MTLPDVALKFILANPAVTTVIPGMRKLGNVEANLKAGDAPLTPAQMLELRRLRWDRRPDSHP